MTITCVLRDDEGRFIASISTAILSLPTIKECEAIVVFEALIWIQALGHRKVIFEMDAKEVVDAFNLAP